MNSFFLRSVAAALFGIWLILFLIGKSGSIHILLLCGISVTFVEIVCSYRRQVKTE